MANDQAQGKPARTDFFISYTGKDSQWAQWIAFELEAAGYHTIIQAWDIRPGSNFVVEMDEAATRALRTIPVLSAAYLGSDFAFAEWAAAFRHDPKGKQGKVLPVRIERCAVEGLLGPIGYIDLVDLDEQRAREKLLAGVKRERAKPAHVSFPGSLPASTPLDHPAFPGASPPTHNTPSPPNPLLARQRDQGTQTIKALFLAANPTSTNRLALDEEMRTIEHKVRAAEYRDALVFQSAWAVRPDDLLQLLNQHRPHIVHFSGHGSSEGLSLAGEHGQERLVSTQALKALFGTLKDNIRLVFLNACYSREQAQALRETIDCIIGMKKSIGDNAAIAFASSFYRAIGFGRSVQEAFDQGITSLLLEGIPEEDIPELLVKDGVDPKQIVLIGQDSHRVPPVPLSKSASPLTANRPIDIFISYAHADKDWCGRLTKRLANLRNQGIIRDWHDGDIVAGTEWRKEIQKHLDEAQIILLLISPNYLASDFCYSVQMKRAIEKHKKGTACVVPLLLRTTDYEGAPFAELAMLPSNDKAVNRWADQDEAFQDIITGIRRSIKALLANP